MSETLLRDLEYSTIVVSTSHGEYTGNIDTYEWQGDSPFIMASSTFLFIECDEITIPVENLTQLRPGMIITIAQWQLEFIAFNWASDAFVLKRIN